MEFRKFSLVLLFLLTLGSSLFVLCDIKQTTPEIKARQTENLRLKIKPNSSAQKYVYTINLATGLASGVAIGLFDYKARFPCFFLWIASALAERGVSSSISALLLKSVFTTCNGNIKLKEEDCRINNTAVNLRMLVSWGSYCSTLGVLYLYNNYYKNGGKKWWKIIF